MFNFFNTIFQYLKVFVDYVVNFFSQLLQLFGNISKALVQISVINTYLPTYVRVFFSSVIFVGIVYFLLNRD